MLVVFSMNWTADGVQKHMSRQAGDNGAIVLRALVDEFLDGKDVRSATRKVWTDLDLESKTDYRIE